MHALVTGASGHLGGWLVRVLRREGHQVRAFVRETSDTRGLDGLGAELFTGDLLDADSLERAAQGIDWFFHAGAVHRNFSPDPEDIRRPSVDGTRNALQAAARAGVKRFIHTSSNATIGYARVGEPPRDEQFHTEDPSCPYIRGKCDAEVLALQAGPALGLDVVVVCPTAIMGPWDLKLTPGTRALARMANGDPAVIDLTLAHAEDMAIGHLLAAQKGRTGQRYLLGADSLTKEQMAEIVGSLVGQKRKAVSPPLVLLRAVAWWEERKARRTGQDAALTQAQLDDVGGRTLLYDATKARTELGWQGRDGATTLRDSLRWIKHRGMLDDRVLATVGDDLAPDPDWPAFV